MQHEIRSSMTRERAIEVMETIDDPRKYRMSDKDADLLDQLMKDSDDPDWRPTLYQEVWMMHILKYRRV